MHRIHSERVEDWSVHFVSQRCSLREGEGSFGYFLFIHTIPCSIKDFSGMQYSSFSRRLFALIILIVVLLFPFGWYYYFVIARQAEIIVSVDKKIPFRVHLEGTFGNSLLPLADRVLDRTLECSHSCSFS